MQRHHVRATLLVCLSAVPLLAQLPSNSTLSGNYNVRYLGVNAASSTGVDVPVSFSGTFTFDGGGNFTLTGQGSAQFASSGKYTVLSSGMVQLTNPFDTVAGDNGVLYGGVGANGVIVASSTESVNVDYLVAIPQPSNGSNALLNGTYNVASITLSGAAASGFNTTSDTFFQVNPNGSGSLGNVSIQGTAVPFNGAVQTQTSAGATYSVTTNGTGTLTLPNSATNPLLSGAQVLAVSPDGNLFIAGSQSSFNFIIGLKTPAAGSNPVPKNYYFTGYLQNYDPANFSSDQFAGIYSSWGSSNEVPSLSVELNHERTSCDTCFSAYDYIYDANAFSFSNGIAQYSDSAYAVGPNADMMLGAGLGNTIYQVVLYVRAPAMTAPAGSTAFLNPQGIVNAASFAPFTSQYSPGEVVTMFGSGIASQDVLSGTATPFPTNGLDGVTVQITGTNSPPVSAPVYAMCASCSPQQVSIVIPYNVTSSNGLVSFQLTNNGVVSNTVSGYLGTTSPGIFTIPSGGIYDGAFHTGGAAAGKLADNTNKAANGETVAIFLTGLGPVSPAVTAGTAAPGGPNYALAVNPVYLYITDSAGKVFPVSNILYAGLAPGEGGLYQINFTLPTGMASGTAYMEVITAVVVDQLGNTSEDVDVNEATIQIQ